MAVTECALCGRAADSRSMRGCEECSAPLCSECALSNHNRCQECTDDLADYDMGR